MQKKGEHKRHKQAHCSVQLDGRVLLVVGVLLADGGGVGGAAGGRGRPLGGRRCLPRPLLRPGLCRLLLMRAAGETAYGLNYNYSLIMAMIRYLGASGGAGSTGPSAPRPTKSSSSSCQVSEPPMRPKLFQFARREM